MKRVLGGCLAVGLGVAAALAETRTWDGTSGWWTNETKWGGTVPQAPDQAVFPAGSYTVTLDRVTENLAGFTQNGGVLLFTNWDACLRATEVLVNTGRLTHAVCDTNKAPGVTNRVYILAQNVTLAGTNALINVDARGFPGATNAYLYGQGPGGAYSDGTDYGGGGHGGRGGTKYGGLEYDSTNQPVMPGSGGGSKNNTSVGGTGGGVVRIEAPSGRVTVNGSITTYGGNFSGTVAGGGAGGSIWITCSTFAGSGLLGANAGSADTTRGGPGAGGRIAIAYDPVQQRSAGLATPSQLLALAGSGGNPQTAPPAPQDGTIHLTDGQAMPNVWTNSSRLFFPDTSLTVSVANLTIQSGLVEIGDVAALVVGTNLTVEPSQTAHGLSLTRIPSVVVSNNMTVRGGRVVLTSATNVPSALTCMGRLGLTSNGLLYVYSAITNSTYPSYGALVDVTGDMVVSNGAWVYPALLVQSNSADNGGCVLFRMTNLWVGTNAGFNAVGRGYAGRMVESGNGFGPGGGYYTANDWGGGGYGGAGGYAGPTNGQPYGSLTNPLPGSGGSCRSSAGSGGHGGGAIWIQATGRVTLDGSMLADGLDLGGGNAGGGSGGAVMIGCDTFAAGTAAVITASGGKAGTYRDGGGGGGRVAIRYNAASQQAAGLTPGVRFAVSGGELTSPYKGASGTLFLTDDQFLPSDWLGGAVLYFGEGVANVAKSYPSMTFRGGALNFGSLPVALDVAGNVTATGAATFTSQLIFATNATVVFGGNLLLLNGRLTLADRASSLAVGGDLTATNSVLTVGTNLAVGGAINLIQGSSLYAYSISNRPSVVRCGGALAMLTNAVLQVYASETNATFPEYGALVQVGATMTVRSNSWVYPDVWNNLITNNTLGIVKFKVGQNLDVSFNAGFNASSRGYAGQNVLTGTIYHALGPGGGYGGTVPSNNRGGGGYGGFGGGYLASGPWGCPYGSSNAPVSLGSGGINYSGGQGTGGGAIWLQVDGNVEMNGILVANGAVSSSDGAGSGGSILVQTAGKFIGPATAMLSATGGTATANYKEGAGGGGRIAVWIRMPPDQRDALMSGAIPYRLMQQMAALPDFYGQVTAAAGTGKYAATAGTIVYLKGRSTGTLMILR